MLLKNLIPQVFEYNLLSPGSYGFPISFAGLLFLKNKMI